MFRPFPSIDQFRSVVKQVANTTALIGKDENGEPIYDPTRKKPSLLFHGSVKVHGTNAAITRLPHGEYQAQSRSKVLVKPEDNMGFRAWFDELDISVLERIFKDVIKNADLVMRMDNCWEMPITVYGEWAGKGIQKGVAVSDVQRFFYIFAVQIGDVWMSPILVGNITESPEQRIFNGHGPESPFYSVAVDFEDPVSIANAQNAMGAMTQQVEDECPVGKRFGVAGVGEGIVWTCVTPSQVTGSRSYEGLSFKVKGEKHSVSKVTTLASANVEKVKSVQEFVDRTVTENRLKQGLDVLREQGKPEGPKGTGDFIKWLSADVLKEESDVLAESGLTAKDVSGALATAARQWYLANMQG